MSSLPSESANTVEPLKVWEAPDKRFTKTIISKGYGFNTPQDGSVCKIKVIHDESKTLTQVNGEQIKEIIIGDVDDPIDRIIEACVRTMKDEEICNLIFYHPSYFAQIKPEQCPQKTLEIKETTCDQKSLSDSEDSKDVDNKSLNPGVDSMCSDKEENVSIETSDEIKDTQTSKTDPECAEKVANTNDSSKIESEKNDIREEETNSLSEHICNVQVDDAKIAEGNADEITSVKESKDENNEKLQKDDCDYLKEHTDCIPSERATTPTMLEVEIQLLSYTREPEIWEMSITEKWRRANYHKQKGMELYARGAYEWAFRRFSVALKYLISLEHDLPSGQEEGMNIVGLKMSCYLNVAACQMRHHNFDSVIKNCTKALLLQPNNTKALYRRGTAYIHLQEYEKAKGDLDKAQELEPKNPDIAKQQQLLKAQIHKLNQYYASAMKKMFT